ncbi:MAG TPA: PIG-L deacetylase family protein [Acidimicrobiales bacterium]|nr:PIG-L deacetylase family protein [Acidimicrobiales bacterium]
MTDTGAVLAVFAHPDDAEIAAGGTLARMAAEGRPVHLLVLTNGDRGSQDPTLDRAELATVRRREQEAAAHVLGLTSWRILNVHDGELENTTAIRAEVVRVMRELRPHTVVTCDPSAVILGTTRCYYNHPDHRAAGTIALDCCVYASGNPHFFPEQLGEGLEPWDVPEALLGWSVEINHHEDVTGYLDTKVAALAEHRSQVSEGNFEEWLPKVAANSGKVIGVTHAEPFRRLRLR